MNKEKEKAIARIEKEMKLRKKKLNKFLKSNQQLVGLYHELMRILNGESRKEW